MNRLIVVVRRTLKDADVRRCTRSGERLSVQKARSEDLKPNRAMILDQLHLDTALNRGGQMKLETWTDQWELRQTQHSSSIIRLGGYEHEKLLETGE